MDASFQLVRQNFVPLMTISVIMLLPSLVLSIVLRGSFVGSLLAFPVQLALSLVAQMAVILAVSDAYLGREIDVGSTIGRAWPLIGAALVAGLFVTFASSLALLFFAVPGVILFTRWAVAQPVIAIEKDGPVSAMGRSFKMTSGSFWHVFGTLFLVYLILIVIIGAVRWFLGKFDTVLPPAVLQTLAFLPGAVFYPVIAAACTLIYYDLRIRKEGFDMEMMAAELGAPPPAGSVISPAQPGRRASV
ncbi:MAG TPA: hypothetical protein VFK13_09065 [Gemmatimonadaceae bacterium]|nr:hypothetical protein [Gemmatimonadaceae bacterium]